MKSVDIGKNAVFIWKEMIEKCFNKCDENKMWGVLVVLHGYKWLVLHKGFFWYEGNKFILYDYKCQ